MVLEVIFWILLILSAIGAFLPETTAYVVKSRFAIVLVLLGILGLHAFHNPLSK